MGTADAREAERRATPILAQWYDEIARAERQQDDFDVERAAVELGYTKLMRRLVERQRSVGDDDAEIARFLAKQDRELQRISHRLLKGDVSFAKDIIDREIESGRFPITKGTPTYNRGGRCYGFRDPCCGEDQPPTKPWRRQCGAR